MARARQRNGQVVQFPPTVGLVGQTIHVAYCKPTAKMHQIRFRLGLRPSPRPNSLLYPLAGFQGPTSKGWGEDIGKGKRREKAM